MTIPLIPIVQSLGESRLAALPAFHALSGADVIGYFAGKGKQTCWEAFKKASANELASIATLGTITELPMPAKTAVERFVCWLYYAKTTETSVAALRWKLFKRHQNESEKLPPTEAALQEATLRCHHQMLMWNQDIIPGS